MKSLFDKSLMAMLFFCIIFITPLSYGIEGDEPKKEGPLSFVEIARAVKPSVVNIYTVSIENSQAGENFHNNEKSKNPFSDFFDRNRSKKENKKNLGSGVIIDKTGYIITNNHIVDGSSIINVSLASGEEYKAKLIGKDVKTDLALIKIDSNRNLPSAKLGDSNALQVGEWVMAIGNPYGLEESVTVGIVSAKGRVVGAGPYDNFIQTDSPINPGNSGGPLLNSNAEVVGINTLIFKGVQNLGFAIPVNLAGEIFEQLKKNGRVVRGWLGVYIQRVVPEMKEFFNLDSSRGALVSDLTPGSPAEKAGIKRGDIITRFDGVEIEDANDLPLIVARRPVGRKVNVNVLREGEDRVFIVVLGELIDEKLSKQANRKDDGITEFGMRLEFFSEKDAGKLKIGDEAGIYVVDTYPSGQASEKGIKNGDIILEVNRIQMDNINDFKKALKESERGFALLLLKRGNNTFFVTLETE